jgi:hypothetical protein
MELFGKTLLFGGWGILLISVIWGTILAFREKFIYGLLFLLIPGYGLYYIWFKNRQPKLLFGYFGGIAISIAGIVLLSI